MALCQKRDIENVFGIVSVMKWADIDNDGNPTRINDRITWACDLASEFVSGRLILGKYNLPFNNVPTIIKYITAVSAGILLYDGRLNSSTDSFKDLMSRHRKQVSRTMMQVLNGQVTLTDPLSGDPIESDILTVPSILSVSEDTTCSNCCCHTCVCRSINWPPDIYTR